MKVPALRSTFLEDRRARLSRWDIGGGFGPTL